MRGLRLRVKDLQFGRQVIVQTPKAKKFCPLSKSPIPACHPHEKQAEAPFRRPLAVSTLERET